MACGATAQARTRHQIKGSAQVVPVSVSGVLPNLTVGIAGTLSTRPDGKGAIVGKAKYTGAGAANAYTFAGSFSAFLAQGSLKGTLKGTATLQAPSGLTVSGSVKVLRGSGRYDGATGKLKFSGSTILNMPVTVSPFSAPRVKLGGTLTY